MIDLTDRLSKELSLMGAAIVGFADLNALPSERRLGMGYGVSIAVAMDPAVINGIGNGHTREHDYEYHRLNGLLDRLDLKAAEIIREAGFTAWPLTRDNVKIDWSGLGTEVPHKTVATLAGLGWIGKCAMLVTEAYGSAVRVSSVLTDAPFPVGEAISESRCGNCDKCVINCPGEAASGKPWDSSMSREDHFDAYRCHKTCLERAWRVAPGELFCGLCSLVCPWTKKYILSSQKEYAFPPVDIAQPGDLEEILALQKLAFQSEAALYEDYSIAPLLQSLKELRSEARDSIILKAVAGRRIVGSVRGYLKDGTGYIGRLIVHPDHQNQGIGKRLMHAIERCFSDYRLELFTGGLSQKNLALYEKLGYHKFKTEEIREGQVMVFMEKIP
ncbi:MAG: GNAT family N-acetyltransferase [Deltaproteobacteria bacterium]